MKFSKTNKNKQLLPIVFTLFFLIFGNAKSFAQDTPYGPTEETVDTEIYNRVEVHPQYPGGISKFYELIGQNYKVPKIKNLKGKVIVQFVIEIDGSLSDMKVMRDIGYGTGIEALRVLALSPKWKPGIQDGKPVRVLYSIPLSIDSDK